MAFLIIINNLKFLQHTNQFISKMEENKVVEEHKPVEEGDDGVSHYVFNADI